MYIVNREDRTKWTLFWLHTNLCLKEKGQEMLIAGGATVADCFIDYNLYYSKDAI